MFLYKGLISFASLLHKKAKLKIEGVRNSKKIISKLDDLSKGKRILIHCSSQGEHEQALPIIRWILKNTDYDIVLSFFSPSGYTYAKHDQSSRIIKTYLPFDTQSEISKFINSIQPQLTLIIKNEWWWNFLNELKKQNIPTYLVSATIRKGHYFIKYPKPFFINGLSVFYKVFVIDQSSKINISKVFKRDVIVAGDTRIDQANYNKNEILHSNKLVNKNHISTLPTIVYGSIWESDLDSINMLIHLHPDARHLIYPHDLSKNNIELLHNNIKNSSIISTTNKAIEKVNIVATMGELKYAYNFATLAYIGGGFGDGIHNVLEAAVYWIPTFFGPNYLKSNEAISLLESNCSFSFKDKNDLEQICEKISMENSKEINRNEIETKLKSYFSPKHSPTEIICQEIFKKIDINV